MMSHHGDDLAYEMTKRPNPHAKALRLGIYQPKKVPGKKGKGSYKRVKKEEKTNDGG